MLNLSPVDGLSEAFFDEVVLAVVLVVEVAEEDEAADVVVTTGSLNVFFARISVCLGSASDVCIRS